MMANIPILQHAESTSITKGEDSDDDILDSVMNAEEENEGESNNGANEVDIDVFEDSYAAASSSFSSEKVKKEPPSFTTEDVRLLPPMPKGVPTGAKPYYYALEKVKVKRDEVQDELDELRKKTEEVKKEYESLCNRLAKKESEMATLESTVHDRSEEFFEARLEQDDDWNTMYKQLRAYREEHGDFYLEKDDNPDLEKLKRWVKRQREAKRKGTLKPFREAALERLNFPWRLSSEVWIEKYNELVAYKETHGHVLVDKDENPDLASWIKLQQLKLSKNYKANHYNEISAERERLLAEIGVKEHHFGMRWDLNFETALQHKITHGQFPSTKGTLGAWVARQKKQYYKHKRGEKCKLSAEQIEKLHQYEFEDESEKVDLWKERFDELVQYKEEHGCFPPIQVDKVRTKLGVWVGGCRAQYKYMRDGKRHTLTPERKRMLDSIGFPWSVGNTLENPTKTWEQRYEDLVAYHIEHGHCRVSVSDKENYSLAKWVKRQRENYWALKEGREKKGPMTPERVRLLEALGFSWQVRSRRNGPDKKQTSLGT